MNLLFTFLIFFTNALDVAPEFQLKKGVVGKLAVGDPMSSLEKNYTSAQIKKSVHHPEGHAEPIVEIRLDPNTKEPDFTVRAHNEKINGISVNSAKFKTLNNIGVGATLADIQKHYTTNNFSRAEECYCVVIKELNMSFGLEMTQQVLKADKDIAKMPGNTKIVSVHVR
jgi:hypothetical protein